MKKKTKLTNKQIDLFEDWVYRIYEGLSNRGRYRFYTVDQLCFCVDIEKLVLNEEYKIAYGMMSRIDDDKMIPTKLYNLVAELCG